jgi:FkbM family methyltransferase
VSHRDANVEAFARNSKVNRLRLRWRLARDIAGLGRGCSGSLAALLVCLTMPLRARIPRFSNRLIRLRLTLGEAPVDLWLSDGSELAVIWSIFITGEYAALDVRGARTIVDLGANIGVTTLWFRSLNRDARIVSVEPDPRTFEKLRLNVAHDPLVTCVNAAIVPVSGPVTFTSAAESWVSRVGGSASASAREVPGITLDELLANEGIGAMDILKVDIEGMEYSVLPQASSLANAGQVIGELHPDLVGNDVGGFVDELATGSGLTRVPGVPSHLFLLRRDGA